MGLLLPVSLRYVEKKKELLREKDRNKNLVKIGFSVF